MFIKRYLFYGYFLGYILAIAGPIFIDPQLITHVQYGSRAYPLAPLTVPIILALATVEWIVLRRDSSSSTLYRSLIPFAVACLVTLPLFPPELPHGNIVQIGLATLLMGAVTVAINNWAVRLPIARLPSTQRTEYQIAYLKEALSAGKQILVGLLAAFTVIVFSWHKLVMEVFGIMVKTKAELFILQAFLGANIILFSIFFLIGPVYCVFRAITTLLFQMKSIAQNVEETAGEKQRGRS